MTDKEQYQAQKQAVLDKRRKNKAINYLKTEVNRKLIFGVSDTNGFSPVTEEQRIDLLRQLEAIEVNEATVRGNKFNSSSYSFTPSRKYKMK